MVVGDNHYIQSNVLSSMAILEAIPQLRTLGSRITQLTAQCSTCQGNPQARDQLAETWNEVRQLLVELPESKKAIIRDKVSRGQRIRISYRVGRGQDTKIQSGDI